MARPTAAISPERAKANRIAGWLIFALAFGLLLAQAHSDFGGTKPAPTAPTTISDQCAQVMADWANGQITAVQEKAEWAEDGCP